MQNRDKKEYCHKGYRKNTIKTIIGEVEYNRAIYLKENKTTYLIDTNFGIQTYGKISANLAEVALNISYRKAKKAIQNTTNSIISHQTLDQLVWKVGKVIEKRKMKK